MVLDLTRFKCHPHHVKVEKPKRVQFDLVNQTFGRLTVTSFHAMRYSRSGRSVKLWAASCACGSPKETIATTSDLRNGHTQSCGCLQRERVSAARFKHGHTVAHDGAKGSPEYKAWCDMKSRCLNPANERIAMDYRDRGITVCAEWIDDFESFLDHIGLRPGPGYSLDRIDNDGNYEPGNVRWATALQQNNNQRPRLR